MLRYKGRENLEDYDAVFLIQLESWEAAINSGLAPESSGKTSQPIEIAKLLGWIRFHSRDKAPQLNDTARACNAAYAAIQSGENTRTDFEGLSVAAALVHYDAMCREIEAAHRIDEVKDIRDKAVALELYARQAQDLELERKCAAIRYRAERRCGKLQKKWQRRANGKGAAAIENQTSGQEV
jgi:hypothetical protein